MFRRPAWVFALVPSALALHLGLSPGPCPALRLHLPPLERRPADIAMCVGVPLVGRYGGGRGTLPSRKRATPQHLTPVGNDEAATAHGGDRRPTRVPTYFDSLAILSQRARTVERAGNSRCYEEWRTPLVMRSWCPRAREWPSSTKYRGYAASGGLCHPAVFGPPSPTPPRLAAMASARAPVK